MDGSALPGQSFYAVEASTGWGWQAGGRWLLLAVPMPPPCLARGCAADSAACPAPSCSISPCSHPAGAPASCHLMPHRGPAGFSCSVSASGQQRHQGACSSCCVPQLLAGALALGHSFPVLPRNRTRGEGHKRGHNMLHPNSKGKGFTVGMTQHWKGQPRGVIEPPSLEPFQPPLLTVALLRQRMALVRSWPWAQPPHLLVCIQLHLADPR